MIYFLMFLFYLSLNLKPQAVDEVTVDPVQDDIEIVNEGEGTDAFAVSIYLNPSNPDSDQISIKFLLVISMLIQSLRS